MAAPAKEKWKGKEWYQITAPAWMGETVIGETATLDSSTLPGRVVEAGADQITGDPSKFYMKMFFKIDSVNGAKVSTIFYGHELMRDFVARAISVRASRIDSNNVVTFQDGKMRVKALAVTTRPVYSIIKTKLRKQMSDLIIEIASKITVENFIKAVVDGKLQNDVRAVMNKTYPIRFFEITKTEPV
jgi:small subunit ribosomal protein S3Ae